MHFWHKNIHCIFMTFSDQNTSGLRYFDKKAASFLFILHEFIAIVTSLLYHPLQFCFVSVVVKISCCLSDAIYLHSGICDGLQSTWLSFDNKQWYF